MFNVQVKSKWNPTITDVNTERDRSTIWALYEDHEYMKALILDILEKLQVEHMEPEYILRFLKYRYLDKGKGIFFV
jgi:hypothetical protein